ncbi:MAG: microcin C ABC transporter permease YejB [Deltaproteobacteria bacterium]|jgi:microcin C transport system permease protein|nr:microcin C ABC transporter permease YejB [Deltaproteobacteria bacterium]MBT4629433.1 microcin C ABC transporter permease YejB [Deltaproteobacteria bacterium]MBT5485774.1 microcin C ABC transporter permease YejB [Deltaproteobacteria bacterium]MBT5833953.1 microcin C ABC transporter permease YejB [Deltaproteobacteria bacterium]MCH1520809.1 microcin C ABC transporter permease YejB [SAR324 cluster bacterium]|tara:strand:- start:2189 stop:3286 length:1098 start_codon:yes stop_codon:yes gene_type:complete
MTAYIIRRLLLVIPTLIGIMTVNFIIIQIAPGGPVEQMIAHLQGEAVNATERLSGGGEDVKGQKGAVSDKPSKYRGTQGLAPELVEEIERMYGFDKPLHVRYFKMMRDYASFNFGESFFRDQKVVDLVLEKMPVSISLGIWSTLAVYLVSIPLGIRKALKHGSRFDIWSSTIVILGNAIPTFLFAILLIVLFSGGSYLSWFPLRGLLSDNFSTLPWWHQLLDYFWHLVLPITAILIGSFASLTMLTKNSFLDEINKQYVITARAKGLTERRVLYKHVFRNAMLIIIAGFPAAFIGMFFTGSLLIEIIFSLDGLGLLGFESTIQRDYPVMFGTLFVFTLLGLIVGIISDLMYTVIDPRIDFETREA